MTLGVILSYVEFFQPSYAYSNIIPFRLFGIQSNKKESNAARGPFKTIEIPKKPALLTPRILAIICVKNVRVKVVCGIFFLIKTKLC